MVKEFDEVFVVIVTCVLMIEMVIGLIANISVLVITRNYSNKHLERGNSFNINLHIVDSVICVTIIPLTITYLVTSRLQTPIFCSVFKGTVSFTGSASSLTLFFICLDRYFVVTTPTGSHIISKRANMFITIVWIFALFAFCSTFFGINSEIMDWNTWNNSTCDDILWTMGPYYFHEIFYIIAFLLTTFGMAIFYLAINKYTRERLAVKDALMKASLSVGVGVVSPRDKDGRTLKLSLAIVCAFLVFWGPHLVVTIVTIFARDSLALDIIQIICLTFAFMTTVIHPLLYAAMRQKFREAVRKRWNRERAAVGCLTNEAKIPSISIGVGEQVQVMECEIEKGLGEILPNGQCRLTAHIIPDNSDNKDTHKTI